ncbi:biotin/lipoyl-binding protein, partial [Halomonas sp. BBD45]
MKQGGKIVVALVAVVALGALAWWGVTWWKTGRFIEETDNAYVHTDSVAVRSELSARIVDVAVTDNQAVRQGDLLVRLDASD